MFFQRLNIHLYGPEMLVGEEGYGRISGGTRVLELGLKTYPTVTKDMNKLKNTTKVLRTCCETWFCAVIKLLHSNVGQVAS
jgi:hypothetical protein